MKGRYALTHQECITAIESSAYVIIIWSLTHLPQSAVVASMEVRFTRKTSSMEESHFWSVLHAKLAMISPPNGGNTQMALRPV